MYKKPKTTTGVFEVDMLDPECLQSEATFEGAIGTLESDLLSLDDDGRASLIGELLALEHRFEFAMSMISDDVSSSFISWAMFTFPTQIDHYLHSVQSKLLLQLSRTLDQLPEMNSDTHTTVQRSHSCISALHEMLSAEEDVFVSTRESSRKRKDLRGGRKGENGTTFLDAGVSVPTSRKEAKSLAKDILLGQKHMLQELLVLLRKPQHQELLKKVYLSTEATALGGVYFTRSATKSNTAPFSQSRPVERTIGVKTPRAYLGNDVVEGFGELRVSLSNKADNALRKVCKKDETFFSGLMDLIRELSHGRFSGSNHIRLTSTGSLVPVYQAKLSRGYRLLYHLNDVRDLNSGDVYQGIRILAIEARSRMDLRFWEAVANELSRERGSASTFSSGEAGGGAANYIPPLHGDDIAAELHSLLVLGKFHALSQAALENIKADRDASYIFEMSPQEEDIVKHPSSCYVIGRSGTGKTTTMLFKIFGLERTWANTSPESLMGRPRQMFITQSMKLAEKVKEAYEEMCVSLSEAERGFWGDRNSPSTDEAHSQGARNRDVEASWSTKRYSDLEDHEFPFFCTLDQLYRMIENDLVERGHAVVALTTQDNAPSENRSADYMQQDRMQFVSYKVFLKYYWNGLHQVRSQLDPSLAFAEIMSVIKGSEGALAYDPGYLDRDSYVVMSERTQGTFAGRRHAIYDIFEQYERQKRKRGEYDAADRTQSILKGLRGGIPGKCIDYLYVDEAQDNLMVDALVLRALCRNPDGLFWAGDTAQTISTGSSFRFNDLKAFMYRVEERAAEERGMVWQKRTPPRLFTLSVNYRSHGGIIDCANTVIQLITQFWPASIDPIPDERTYNLNGVKPIFFGNDGGDRETYNQFLFKPSVDNVQFGARQCILVRDDAALKKFEAEVGKIGLVMTLYASKGLEFNDVLLYNFFADSTANASQWNTLRRSPDTINSSFHHIICRELKALYVGITRARYNVWMVDCSENATAMLHIWASRAQIKVHSPGDPMPRLAQSSTPAEWAVTAQQTFDAKNFREAMFCYERANLLHERGIAEAWYLREEAVTSWNHVEAGRAFVKVARHCTSTGDKEAHLRLGADCFMRGESYAEAAKVYYEVGKIDTSLKCYLRAKAFDDAAGVLSSHQHSIPEELRTSARKDIALHYLKDGKISVAAKLFPSDDDALEFMKKHNYNPARAKYLESLKRYFEAGEIYLQIGKLDAAQMQKLKKLFADCDPHQARRLSRLALDRLWVQWSNLVFKPSSSLKQTPTAYELLEVIAEIVKKAESDGLSAELTIFQDLKTANSEELFTLADSTQHANPPAAVLYFDQAFSLAPDIRDFSVEQLSSYLSYLSAYVHLLHGILLGDCCTNHTTQKLFGFTSRTSGDWYLPEYTILFAGARGSGLGAVSKMMKESALGPLVQRVIGEEMKARITQEVSRCREVRILMDPATVHHPSPKMYAGRIRILCQQIVAYDCMKSLPRELSETQRQGEQKRSWIMGLYQALNHIHYNGNNLHSQSIPELEEGLAVVGNWLVELSCLIGGLSKEHFLTFFLVSCSLSASVIPGTREEVFDNLASIPLPMRPLYLLQGDYKAFIGLDALGFFNGDRANSIDRGISFISFVTSERVPIDIQVLCDVMDRLCGMLVIASRRRGDYLNNLTLPLPWFSELAPRLPQILGMVTTKFMIYAEVVQSLLQQLYSAKNIDHLQYRNKKFTALPPALRKIFACRLYRNLCLLGYNQRPPKLIGNMIEKLRGVIGWPPLHPFYTHYFAPMVPPSSPLGWMASELGSGYRNEKLVHLHHPSMARTPSCNTPGVRCIVFHDPGEIPALLQGPYKSILRRLPHPSQRVRPPPRTTGPTRAPNLRGTPERPEVEKSGPLEQPSLAPQPELKEPMVLEEIGDPLTVDDTPPIDEPDTTQEVHPGNSYTAEHERAAKVIQRGIRLYRRRLWEAATPRQGIAVLREEIYQRYLATSMKLKFSSVKRRCIFLGVVPHVLLCTEELRKFAHGEKKAAKKEFKGQGADATARLNDATKLVKDSEKLYKEFGPDSDIYKKEDWVKLKSAAQQVADLVKELPPKVLDPLKGDLELGCTGMLSV